jgi:predicted nucleic acid-binding protein
MLVVGDTSALVALAAGDVLELLEPLALSVRVPPAVHRECTVAGKAEAERLETYLRSRVIKIDLREFVIASSGLGQGELEAMALCRRLEAHRLLVDDYRARKVALLNGIEVIGSLGILLRAKEAGHIPVLRPLVLAIQASGIRYSEQLVAEALRIAGEP